MRVFTLWAITGLILSSCSSQFLDERPNSDIITPKQAADFQRLLDNFNEIGHTSSLPLLSSDEYFIPSREAWLAAGTAVERQSYVWGQDIYGGEVNIEDWNSPYRTIFYANNIINNILEQEAEMIPGSDLADVYGQSLFHRARANFDLLKNFSVPFDSSTHETDLGIPLRIDPSIDYTLERSTVKECYDAIFKDLDDARNHLHHLGPLPQRNRATRLAVFALLSRVHLYRRDYRNAEALSDSVLNKYNKLIDYNTVSSDVNWPFSLTNEELIMYGRATKYNNANSLNPNESVFVDTSLMELYDKDDLRLKVFFTENNAGRFTMKGGYNGSGLGPFTGFAVDEVMLNKIECLVRRGDLSEGSRHFNRLLSHRYKTDTYEAISFDDQRVALQAVLTERRKQLIWRGRRWDDIKRLNKEGAGIVLQRVLGDTKYILEPNSERYVFNIPQDEINRSGIVQNQR